MVCALVRTFLAHLQSLILSIVSYTGPSTGDVSTAIAQKRALNAAITAKAASGSVRDPDKERERPRSSQLEKSSEEGYNSSVAIDAASSGSAALPLAQGSSTPFLHRGSVGAASFFQSRASVSRVELKKGGAGGRHPLLAQMPTFIRELKDSLPLPPKKSSAPLGTTLLGGAAKRASPGPSAAAIECVAKLAEAFGANFGMYMTDFVPHLFSGGLSPTLLDTLKALSKHVPSQSPVLQQHVLDAVAFALTKVTFTDWASLPVVDRSSTFASTLYEISTTSSIGGTGDSPHRNDSCNPMVLAVRTLGLFDGIQWRATPAVTGLVLEMASHFLSAGLLEMRRAAAVACTTLLNGALDPMERAYLAAADAADRKSSESTHPATVPAVKWADGDTTQRTISSDGKGNHERIEERAILRKVQQKVLMKVSRTVDSSQRRTLCYLCFRVFLLSHHFCDAQRAVAPCRCRRARSMDTFGGIHLVRPKI